MKKYFIITFLISMVPVVELRGAIPYAAYHELPFGWAFALTVIGNLLPVPFILWFIPALFRFMRRHHILVGLVDWLERKARKGADKMNKRGAAEPTDETDGVVPANGETVDAAPEAETVGPTDETPAKGGRAAGTLAFLGLYLFVAIPLPGTGAWTGSLVAAVFGMKKRRALPAVILGVLTAGVIMTLASYGIVSAFRFFAK